MLKFGTAGEYKEAERYDFYFSSAILEQSQHTRYNWSPGAVVERGNSLFELWCSSIADISALNSTSGSAFSKRARGRMHERSHPNCRTVTKLSKKARNTWLNDRSGKVYRFCSQTNLSDVGEHPGIRGYVCNCKRAQLDKIFQHKIHVFGRGTV